MFLVLNLCPQKPLFFLIHLIYVTHSSSVTTYTYSIKPHADGQDIDITDGLGDFLKWV